jgi:hypothetical protein
MTAKPTLESATADLVVTTSDILKATAEAFPEMAGQGAKYYAEYIMADGITGLIMAGVWLIISLIGLFFVIKGVVHANKPGTHPDVGALVIGAAAILTLATFIISLTVFSANLPQVIAPEGYMLKEIIRTVNR